MNKPAEPAVHLAPLQVEYIPVAAIAASPTNPRKHFDAAGITELAQSVAVQGVLQPLLLRPFANGKLGITHELVAGERRWRAARQAKLAHVPALVRQLTDVEVLEIQITENLQRQDLGPLEEAAGYKALMQLKKINAHELAELLGKSRSYVYTRTKLNDLSAKARKALEEGKIDASLALLIARIPAPDLQDQALKEIIENDDGWGTDEPMSYRQAHQHIQEHFTLGLKDAPFDIADATLLPAAGACGPCPKRTGNALDLFGDVKSRDVCTDPKCFAAKRAALAERRLAELEASGKKVIKGKDAEEIVRYSYYDTDHPTVGGGYVGLDERCRDDPANRTVRQVLGKNTARVEVVQTPKGERRLIEVIRTDALKDHLNERGIKTSGQKQAVQAQKTRKENEQAEVEEQVLQGVLKAIYAKLSGKAVREDLALVNEALISCFDGYYGENGMERIEAIFGTTGDLGKRVDAMKKTEELLRFGVLLALIILDRTTDIRAVAKRLKIDEARIRREVTAAAKKADNKK